MSNVQSSCGSLATLDPWTTAFGKRVTLPSSYQDAMSIVLGRGPPDLFITFTANPIWPEMNIYFKLSGENIIWTKHSMDEKRSDAKYWLKCHWMIVLGWNVHGRKVGLWKYVNKFHLRIRKLWIKNLIVAISRRLSNRSCRSVFFKKPQQSALFCPTCIVTSAGNILVILVTDVTHYIFKILCSATRYSTIFWI